MSPAAQNVIAFPQKANKPYKLPMPVWISLPVRTILNSFAIGIAASILLIQTILRLAYGVVFILGFILLFFIVVGASMAGWKVAPDYWPNAIHGESFFFIMVAAGIVIDILLFGVMGIAQVINLTLQDLLPD